MLGDRQFYLSESISLSTRKKIGGVVRADETRIETLIRLYYLFSVDLSVLQLPNFFEH